MKQTGLVLETKEDNIAVIKIQRHSACASCGGCGMSKDKATMSVEALNKVGARTGDFVELDIDAPNVLKAAMIVYTIPLFVLVLSTVLSINILNKMNYSGDVEWISFVIGFILTAITYIIIRIKDSKFKKSNQFMPIITQIKYE